MPLDYTLHKSSGEKVRVLEDNAARRDTLVSYQMPIKEFVEIPLEQATLNGYILKPHDCDPDK